jgi:hypothetical protein
MDMAAPSWLSFATDCRDLVTFSGFRFGVARSGKSCAKRDGLGGGSELEEWLRVRCGEVCLEVTLRKGWRGGRGGIPVMNSCESYWLNRVWYFAHVFRFLGL